MKNSLTLEKRLKEKIFSYKFVCETSANLDLLEILRTAKTFKRNFEKPMTRSTLKFKEISVKIKF